MYILGVCNGHIATAVLLKDGKIIACVSEERFNGIKSYDGFPKGAIDWCLKEEKIKGKDLDLIVTPYLYRPPIHAAIEQKERFILLRILASLSEFINIFREIFRRLRYEFPFLKPVGFILYRIATFFLGSYYTRKQKRCIADYLGIAKNKVLAFDHHLSHAACAYYSSPFNGKKALVMTLDAEGDNYCASVSIFDGKRIKVLSKTPREFSLGYIFSHVTKFLGMQPHEHEYKVMGLAPYAKSYGVDKIYKKIKDCIFLDPENPLNFKTRINSQDFGIFLEKEMKEVRFDYLAGAFQKLVEEKVCEWISAAVKKTKIKRIAFAGGVFMNVKANQKIIETIGVKEVFFMPSSGDESSPLGACYLGFLKLNKNQARKVSKIDDLYWGPEFSDVEVRNFLKKWRFLRKYNVRKLGDIEKEIGGLLAKGKIVARFKGKMEFGARALGNRSILANPSDFDVVRIINEQLKNRDFWMPFAPTILSERMLDYMVNPKKINAPYMILSFNSTPLARKHLRAALHPYDFTLRPQILTDDFNHDYYRLIKEFEKLTGIGGVLNTSFNLHGFPIVMGPKEAMETFENSGLEYLAIGNYLVAKQK